MQTMAITVTTPAVGQLEQGFAGGWNSTEEQRREEEAAREKVLQTLVPFLGSLERRPSRRSGNVSGFELLGTNSWSEFNHYLLLIEIDFTDRGLVDELTTLLPSGSSVALLGEFDTLATSEPPPA